MFLNRELENWKMAPNKESKTNVDIQGARADGRDMECTRKM